MVSSELSKKKQAKERNGEDGDKDTFAFMPNKKFEPPTRQQPPLCVANTSWDYAIKRVTSRHVIILQMILYMIANASFVRRVADHPGKKRRTRRRFGYRSSQNRQSPCGGLRFCHIDRSISAYAYVEKRVLNFMSSLFSRMSQHYAQAA